MGRLRTPRGIGQPLSRLALPALSWLVLLGCGLLAIQTSERRPQLTVVCSSIEELCQDWAREFSSASGVEVSMVRMSTGAAGWIGSVSATSTSRHLVLVQHGTIDLDA